MTSADPDLISTWQFELPHDLIASRPTASREDARLLVVNRSEGSITHSGIRQLPDWLQRNDVLVFNNTRVIPARLFGIRSQTGGRWEGLYLDETPDGFWRILCETRGRLQPNERITVYPAYAVSRRRTAAKSPSKIEPGHHTGNANAAFSNESFELTLVARESDGVWIAASPAGMSTLERLETFGSLPLPPYMGRKLADESDQERYQTSFASEPGAIAAPTAGLHFTPELMHRCQEKGINRAEITLHVGIGTFRPVTSDRLSEHQMHQEWCRLPQETCDAMAAARVQAGRVVAVGTTSVRTLESAAARMSDPADVPAPIHGSADSMSVPNPKPMLPWEGHTRMFIRPGHSFRAVDALLTNFHLPGSTLIVLVAAFAGFELTMEAYRQAISERYRFYSYGDAMLIL